MRKASREMPSEWAYEIFDKAPYITVAMTDMDGTPYALPLSLARVDDKTFYFHGAMEGKKLDILSKNPKVWLSAVTTCKPVVGPKDNSFTLEFKSAMAQGIAEVVTDETEKIKALRAICERFLPKHMDVFYASIARSLGRTAVVRITLTEPPTGKRKQYDSRGDEMKYGRMENDSISFRNATIDDAFFISRGFHMAMLYEDASDEQISNFARNICVREDVLYSWRNTIIAEIDNKPAGMLTAYDGRFYNDMRNRTMSLVKQHLGIEFPGMEDEAVAGEYYLDSLAVLPEYRSKGIGRKLLMKGIERGKALCLDVTLAVDPINDRAKNLYSSLGFKPSGTLFIFGHDYEKMIIPT